MNIVELYEQDFRNSFDEAYLLSQPTYEDKCYYFTDLLLDILRKYKDMKDSDIHKIHCKLGKELLWKYDDRKK
jgi:hypothetical protein